RAERIGSEGVNLIALQLSVFLARGQHDHAAAGIHFHRHQIRRLEGMSEQLLQHTDDVVVGMVVIVEQDHVVGRLPFGSLLRIGLGCRDGVAHVRSPLSASRHPLPAWITQRMAESGQVRPRQIKVMSSCGSRLVAWCWTALASRSPSTPADTVPDCSTTRRTPAMPKEELRTSRASVTPSLKRIRLSPGCKATWQTS